MVAGGRGGRARRRPGSPRGAAPRLGQDADLSVPGTHAAPGCPQSICSLAFQSDAETYKSEEKEGKVKINEWN